MIATLKAEDVEKIMLQAIPGIETPEKVPYYLADELTEEHFIINHVEKNQACLIKGGVKHWPAIDKWKDKEYWLKMGEGVKIEAYTHMNFLDPELQKEDKEVLSYHDAVNRLYSKKDRVFSMPSEILNKYSHLEDIREDMAGFTFLSNPPKPRSYPQARVFSYRNASTAWHYHDVDETLMCQLKGAKRVALLSPDIPNVEEVAAFLQEEKHLKGEKLDASLDLKPLMVDVEEGDCLYIPPYWYHAVIPLDDEVGYTLAYCWKSPIHKLGDFSSYFVRQLFKQATRPVRPLTFVYPFIASVAWVSYKLKKSQGKI